MEILVGLGIILGFGAIAAVWYYGLHLAYDREKWYGWIIFAFPILAVISIPAYFIGDAILNGGK